MEVWMQIIQYIKRDRDKLNVLLTCKTLYTLLNSITFRDTYLWGLEYPFTDITCNIKKFKYVVTSDMCDSGGVFRRIIPPEITYLKCKNEAYITADSIHSDIHKIQCKAIYFDEHCYRTFTSVTHIVREAFDNFDSIKTMFPNLRKITISKHFYFGGCVPSVNVKYINIRSLRTPIDGIYWTIPHTVNHVVFSTPNASYYVVPESVKFLTLNRNIVLYSRVQTFSYILERNANIRKRWTFVYRGKAFVRFTKKFTMDIGTICMPNITHVRFSKHYKNSIYLWVPKSVVYLRYRGVTYRDQEIDQFRI